MADLPQTFLAWMQPFRTGFTAPAFRHALVLVAGAILAPGCRTVTAALRVMGLEGARRFTNYHRVLNRNRWSGCAVARRLLHVLVAVFAPAGPLVIGLDDTIERRWGAKIEARGIYRDPVRSSHGHFVKASTTLALLVQRYLEGALHSEGIVWVEVVRRVRGWLA